MAIPFVDLKAQYKALKAEMDVEIQKVLDNTAFIGGPFVEKFEEDFAQYCQSKYALGVASGTDALWIAMLAAGIGPGDEVITSPNTYFATCEAISLCGATPVFVDVHEDTQLINPDLIEAAITPKTKAITPVHLFGQMADMDPIMAVAEKHSLYVIEDAAQAHGAEYKGRRAGSIGHLGCFSMYPGKNLGAYGEGGAITTDRDDFKTFIQRFRDHGQDRKYIHAIKGTNGRLHGIQGAILGVKLKYLDGWNEARRNHALAYNKLFADNDKLTILTEADYGKPVYHLYPVRLKGRDQVLKAMNEKEIWCGIHYPIPVHLQAAYEELGLGKGSFPVSEMLADEILSLPMFPELTQEQIDTVARELKQLVD